MKTAKLQFNYYLYHAEQELDDPVPQYSLGELIPNLMRLIRENPKVELVITAKAEDLPLMKDRHCFRSYDTFQMYEPEYHLRQVIRQIHCRLVTRYVDGEIGA